MSTGRILSRHGGLGDVLMALAAAQAMRHLTGEPVFLVTAQAFAEVARACPHVDRVIVAGQASPAELEAIELAKTLGRFYNLNPVSFGIAREHQVDAFLWSAGLEAAAEHKHVDLVVPPEAQASADTQSAAAGLRPDAIVLHPAFGDPNRSWPIERWRTLCAELIARGRQVVLIGAGRGEKSALPIAVPGVVDLIGRLEIFETLALLRRARALVTTDGGPLHLAGASDIAIVGLFSVVAGDKRMPYRHGQLGWRSVAVESTCPEFPCYRSLNRPDVFTKTMQYAQSHQMTLNDVFAGWCPNLTAPYGCMTNGHQVEHVLQSLDALGVLAASTETPLAESPALAVQA